MSRFASFLLEVGFRGLETLELRRDFFFAGLDLLGRLRSEFLLRLFQRRELRGERRADLIDPFLRQSAAALPRISERSAARSLHRAAAVRRPGIDRVEPACRSDGRDAAETERAMRAVRAGLNGGARARRRPANAERNIRAVRADGAGRTLNAAARTLNRAARA